MPVKVLVSACMLGGMSLLYFSYKRSIPQEKCLLAYLAIINCTNKFWWRQAYISTTLHAEFAYMSAFRFYYGANKLYLMRKERSKMCSFSVFILTNDDF